MVTVIFYRASSPEESLKGVFGLMGNLREWLQGVEGDFMFSTVELHRLGTPEPEAADGFSELSDGFSELSDGEGEPEEIRRGVGSALQRTVEDG